MIKLSFSSLFSVVVNSSQKEWNGRKSNSPLPKFTIFYKICTWWSISLTESHALNKVSMTTSTVGKEGQSYPVLNGGESILQGSERSCSAGQSRGQPLYLMATLSGPLDHAKHVFQFFHTSSSPRTVSKCLSLKESTMLKRVKMMQMTLARFSDLKDSQMKATLRWSCLALSKVAFALAPVPQATPAQPLQCLTTPCWWLFQTSLVDRFQNGLVECILPKFTQWAEHQ